MCDKCASKTKTDTEIFLLNCDKKLNASPYLWKVVYNIAYLLEISHDNTVAVQNLEYRAKLDRKSCNFFVNVLI